MPTWARPADVVFDHGAAHAAAEAAATMRFALSWSWVAEEDGADAALAGWEGLAAEAFATSHGARRNAAEGLVDALHALERSILGAVDDAIAEQQRVDQRQAAWDAELQAELLAEMEPDEPAPEQSPEALGMLR